MVRVIVLFAMLIAAASAFVAPANRAVVSNTAFARSSAPQAPKMALDGVVDIVSNQIAANSNLIATNVDDNLGYAFPIVGILSLAAFILYLSPPLADE
jgi:hypothetical protein|uniref:Uncharacterized protein n=1 Tax=Vitrella brassicaformis TaxID=1169539 RepID=A0A7S1NZI4_9ALVE